jgi:hypothetical protein
MAVFKKKPAPVPRAEVPRPPRVELPLAHLVSRVKDAAPALEGWEVDAPLVQARLADHYRDLGLAPSAAADFERQSAGLDVEGWRRLALGVALLDDPELRGALAALVPGMPVALQVANGLLGLAQKTAPLTVALARQNATRAEEFARHFAKRVGIGIAGETDEESAARLHEIYYKRLLAEADQARAAAQEKMDKLRQKQTEADGRRRRGKW